MNEPELLYQYCKSWNNLDISFLEPCLDENVEYNSQWVFETIRGKQVYLNYLDSKFKTIKNDIVNSKLIADIGYFKGGTIYAKNKPCLVISQFKRDEIVKVSIIISVHNGKITKIDMCAIPNPSGAILFEIEPK